MSPQATYCCMLCICFARCVYVQMLYRFGMSKCSECKFHCRLCGRCHCRLVSNISVNDEITVSPFFRRALNGLMFCQGASELEWVQRKGLNSQAHDKCPIFPLSISIRNGVTMGQCMCIQHNRNTCIVLYWCFDMHERPWNRDSVYVQRNTRT